MRNKLTALALAGTMAFVECGSDNKVEETLSLRGTVERIRVDVYNESYVAQIAIPGMVTSGDYDNILVSSVDDTVRIGVNFPFFSYGNATNPPEPVGIGDVIEFDLTNGFARNRDGTYQLPKQLPKITGFPLTALKGRINFYEKAKK